MEIRTFDAKAWETGSGSIVITLPTQTCKVLNIKPGQYLKITIEKK